MVDVYYLRSISQSCRPESCLELSRESQLVLETERSSVPKIAAIYFRDKHLLSFNGRRVKILNEFHINTLYRGQSCLDAEFWKYQRQLKSAQMNEDPKMTLLKGGT